MGQSTSKFDFERIVPVFLREPSRSIFCANRPGRIVPGRNWFLRESSRNHLTRRQSLERDWNHAHLQSKKLITYPFIYLLQKWVNRLLNLILSESSQFFCANRPVRFFARIVPVESSQGGTGFCANRPVTT